jgi:hypothetical protein
MGEESFGAIVEDTDEFVVVDVGVAVWRLADGRFILEEDFTVDGEKWRVHKHDADPYPSNPHAHCIAGSRRFIGCKLHLGTGALFDAKNKPLDRYLDKKAFNRLIELIRPKFPGVILPIPG